MPPKVKVEFLMDFPPFWEAGWKKRVKPEQAEALVKMKWARIIDEPKKEKP